MIDFLTGILEAEIDYVGLLSIIAIYFIGMWVAFCTWVLFDAKKKYQNWPKAIGLFFFVLIFNIPAFILYLIIRPEHDDWADVSVVDNAGHQYHYGGVQVPLVHFTGDEGEVQMTFGLSLNPKSITSSSPNMNIDVSWEGEDSNNEGPKFKHVEGGSTVITAKSSDGTKKEDSTSSTSQLEASTSKFLGKLKSGIKNINSSVSGSIGKSASQLNTDEPAEDVVEIKEAKQLMDEVKEEEKKEEPKKEESTSEESDTKTNDSESSDSDKKTESKSKKKKRRRRK